MNLFTFILIIVVLGLRYYYSIFFIFYMFILCLLFLCIEKTEFSPMGLKDVYSLFDITEVPFCEKPCTPQLSSVVELRQTISPAPCLSSYPQSPRR